MLCAAKSRTKAGTAGLGDIRGAECPGALIGSWLVQTVRFVVDVVKSGPVDRALGEYVLAQAFLESRASLTYEARAEGIANDLRLPALLRLAAEVLPVAASTATCPHLAWWLHTIG